MRDDRPSLLVLPLRQPVSFAKQGRADPTWRAADVFGSESGAGLAREEFDALQLSIRRPGQRGADDVSLLNP